MSDGLARRDVEAAGPPLARWGRGRGPGRRYGADGARSPRRVTPRDGQVKWIRTAARDGIPVAVVESSGSTIDEVLRGTVLKVVSHRSFSVDSEELQFEQLIEVVPAAGIDDQDIPACLRATKHQVCLALMRWKHTSRRSGVVSNHKRLLYFGTAAEQEDCVAALGAIARERRVKVRKRDAYPGLLRWRERLSLSMVPTFPTMAAKLVRRLWHARLSDAPARHALPSSSR